jgi:hypothetical protein
VKTIPIPANWLEGYIKILDEQMGKPPASFPWEGREMDPITYAQKNIKIQCG